MQTLDRVDPARIRTLLQEGEFFWLDLLRPSNAEVDELAQLLHLPDLAVEDDREFGQRPKVDGYATSAFVVFFGQGEVDGLVEIHLHVSGDFLVTLRRESCPALDRPWRALTAGEGRSELDAVFRVLDALADSLAAKLEGVGRRVDDLEERAFARPDDDVRRAIGGLRAELFRLQQVVRPQRDMLAADGDLLEELPGLEGPHERHPFREVHDVLVQTSNRIDYLRELLAEALGIYLASTSNHLNQLATRLAVLGTIFLPLTFATGFFGQNFAWLVTHIRSREAFLIWTIGPTLVVLGAAAALGLLSRRHR